MVKKIILLAIIIIAMSFNVFAVEERITNRIENRVENATTATTVQGILERVRERVQVNLQEFEQNREQLKNLMEEKQLELRNLIQERKEELKTIMEQKRNELRNRLMAIKDQNKQQIVEKIYERINKLNERLCDHYLNVLERLEDILERIESRTAKAAANGKDVSLVEQKINDAKIAIENAKEVVANQAGKIYEPPQITTEDNLRLDVGKLRQQLHQDLKAVENVVKAARQAVKDAAVQLAQIPKVNELEIGTTTQTNQ